MNPYVTNADNDGYRFVVDHIPVARVRLAERAVSPGIDAWAIEMRPIVPPPPPYSPDWQLVAYLVGDDLRAGPTEAELLRFYSQHLAPRRAKLRERMRG